MEAAGENMICEDPGGHFRFSGFNSGIFEHLGCGKGMGSRARAGEYVPARVDRTRRAERVADLRLDVVSLDDSSRERRRRWRSLYWKSTVAWGSFLRLHGRILINEQYTTENTTSQACDRLMNGS
jgi:hypothetical protein